MADRSRLTVLAAVTLGAWMGAALPARAQHRRHDDWRDDDWRRRPPHRPPGHRPPGPPPYGPPPGYRPPPTWHGVGRRMPREYLGYNYRVDHWRRYGLPPPRPGHYWVQYGGDFVMVSPQGIGIQLFIR